MSKRLRSTVALLPYLIGFYLLVLVVVAVVAAWASRWPGWFN